MSTAITIYGGFEKIKIEAGHFRRDPERDGKDLIPHIFDIREERRSYVTISAKCFRSMAIRKDPYVVEFLLTPSSRTVVSGRCSCPCGLSFNCKHCAALFYYINTERSESKTDATQRWSAPSLQLQELYPKGASVEHLIRKTNLTNSKHLL